MFEFLNSLTWQYSAAHCDLLYSTSFFDADHCPSVTSVGGTVQFPEVAVSRFFSGGGFSDYVSKCMALIFLISPPLAVPSPTLPRSGRHQIPCQSSSWDLQGPFQPVKPLFSPLFLSNAPHCSGHLVREGYVIHSFLECRLNDQVFPFVGYT